MRGVQYVTDEQGHKVGVLLDLKEWGELWEDIYDTLIAIERKGEAAIPVEEFEAGLRAEGLLNE